MKSIVQQPDHESVPCLSGLNSECAERATYMEMDPNIYSHAFASILRDAKELATGTQHLHLRVARLVLSVMLILFTVFLQAYLVLQVKHLLCAAAVHHIRDVYSEYEMLMYSETTHSVNGKHRGVMGTFQPQNFDDLDDEFKQEVCQIPLSQPFFLSAILFIWSLSVLKEIRKSVMWAIRFVHVTPTVDSVVKMLKDSGEEVVEDQDDSTVTVVGITMVIKVFILLTQTVQVGTAVFLGWVGCRWLVATPSMQDLILNGLALEFILALKDTVYESVLPRRFHYDTQSMRVQTENLNYGTATVFTPIVLIVIPILWVLAYMYSVQQVLPDYRWDVKDTCSEFLSQMRSV